MFVLNQLSFHCSTSASLYLFCGLIFEGESLCESITVMMLEPTKLH